MASLIYIWRSDAINKLLQISDAVKDLRSRLSELVEIERDLHTRDKSISELTATLKGTTNAYAEIKADVETAFSDLKSTLRVTTNDFAEVKADVETMRDKMENLTLQSEDAGSQVIFQNLTNTLNEEANRLDPVPLAPYENAARNYQRMENAWNDLLGRLAARFGEIDRRSVAADIMSFTDRRRRGPTLDKDVAEEIARLHSAMKSSRRRKATKEQWLDDETADDFINACAEMEAAI